MAKIEWSLDPNAGVYQPKATALPPRKCLACPAMFQPLQEKHVFHSAKCRMEKWATENPRIKKAAPPIETSPAPVTQVSVKPAAPIAKRRAPARELSTRFCQRPGCGKLVKLDADRFCSYAHELADMRGSLREKRAKRKAKAAAQAAAKEAKLAAIPMDQRIRAAMRLLKREGLCPAGCEHCDGKCGTPVLATA